jgi:hypothetical protein
MHLKHDNFSNPALPSTICHLELVVRNEGAKERHGCCISLLCQHEQASCSKQADLIQMLHREHRNDSTPKGTPHGLGREVARHLTHVHAGDFVHICSFE